MKNAPIYAPEMLRQLEGITADEIKEMRAATRDKKRELRSCLWCDREVNMRADQKFCSPKCKTAYAMASARIRYDRLLIEQREWEAEREAFVREVAELRHEITELRARITVE